MDKKIKNYVWHAQFVEELPGRQSWVGPDVAKLTRKHGGIAVPDLRAELYATAATSVARWAEQGTGNQHIVGDVLFHNGRGGIAPVVRITPEFRNSSSTGIRRRGTIWATGRDLIARAGCPEPNARFLSEQCQRATEVFALGDNPGVWRDSVYRIDMSHWLGRRRTLQQGDGCKLSQTDYFHTEWLPFAEVAALMVTTPDGTRTTLRKAVFPTCGPGTKIQDVVTWSHPKPGTVEFTFVGVYGMETRADTAAKAAVLLLANYSSLIAARTYFSELHMRAQPADHPVVATLRGHSPVELVIHTTVCGSPVLRQVTSAVEVERTLREFMAPDVRVNTVHSHPKLSRLVCLWAGRRRWTRTRKEYKSRVLEATTNRGLKEIARRAGIWNAQAPTAGKGLAKLDWTRIRGITGLGQWGEQLLYRLKVRALSLYDPIRNHQGCPHEACVHLMDVNLHHVFWDCEAATRLRAIMTQPWRALGVDGAALQAAVYGLRLPDTPTTVWTIADAVLHNSNLQTEQVAKIIRKCTEECWRIAVATYFTAVWHWRTCLFDEHKNSTRWYHEGGLRKRLRTAYAVVESRLWHDQNHNIARVVARVLRSALGMDGVWTASPVRQPGVVSYILFFAGSISCKRNRGGAGSVVVCLNGQYTHTQIVWGVSMAYGPRTTLATAAAMGLLTGLQDCRRHAWWPLLVVGTQKTLITQHTRRTPPKVSRLKDIYWRCRTAMRHFGTVQWTAHSGARNNMATALADRAILSARSQQWTLRDTADLEAGLSGITQWEADDTGHCSEFTENTAQAAPVAVRP